MWATVRLLRRPRIVAGFYTGNAQAINQSVDAVPLLEGSKHVRSSLFLPPLLVFTVFFLL